MAKESFIWTKIMTYNRFMLHILDGFAFTRNLIVGLYYGNFDAEKMFLYKAIFNILTSYTAGILLMHAVIKENRKEINIYLVIAALMLAVQVGFIVYLAVEWDYDSPSFYYIVDKCYEVAFCGYESLLFYFVIKFGKMMQEDSQDSPSEQRKDESVEEGMRHDIIGLKKI